MVGIRGRFLLGRLGLFSGAFAVSFRECIYGSVTNQPSSRGHLFLYGPSGQQDSRRWYRAHGHGIGKAGWENTFETPLKSRWRVGFGCVFFYFCSSRFDVFFFRCLFKNNEILSESVNNRNDSRLKKGTQRCQ